MQQQIDTEYTEESSDKFQIICGIFDEKLVFVPLLSEWMSRWP